MHLLASARGCLRAVEPLWLSCLKCRALCRAPPDAPKLLQYVASMYWAFTTLTTVGYGDISAKTVAERIYAIIAQASAFHQSQPASLVIQLHRARLQH